MTSHHATIHHFTSHHTTSPYNTYIDACIHAYINTYIHIYIQNTIPNNTTQQNITYILYIHTCTNADAHVYTHASHDITPHYMSLH